MLPPDYKIYIFNVLHNNETVKSAVCILQYFCVNLFLSSFVYIGVYVVVYVVVFMVSGWVACDVEVADDTVEYLRQVLTSTYKSYTFMYQGAVDETGHALTWCNAEYMSQVDAADGHVGQVLDLLDELGK